MIWQITVFATPTVFAFVVTLFLAGYALVQYTSGMRDPVVVLFFWVTIATLVWTGFSALKLLHVNPDTKLLFYRLLHVGAAVLPPLFFLFVIAYTDRTRWLRPTVVGGVFVLPCLFVALLFVDPGGVVVAGTEQFTNGLVVVRVHDGPGFLVFMFYSTVLVLAALALLLIETWRIGSTYYPQSALITGAVIAPIGFGLLTQAAVPPFVDDRINLVPTSAAVSTVVLGFLLVRYRLFALPPLAYTTAMKYSPDGIFVLDRDGRIVHVNGEGRTVLEQADAGSGASLPSRFGGLELETVSGELIEIERGLERSVYYRVFVTSLTRGGRHVGWVLILRDETAQQRRQEKLRRQNEHLDRFAATISHDLRNPLSVAQGFLELARSDVDHDALDRIENAHARIEELTEELLMLAREGKQLNEIEPAMLPAVADQAWETVETDSATLAIETTQSILADSMMLRQIFENLFRNAVEHGGADVHIVVGDLDDGFFIEDDGPGIPERDRQTALTSGYSTSTEGSGLGLEIVRSIAEAHGWRVVLVDGNDGGARIEFTAVDRAACE